MAVNSPRWSRESVWSSLPRAGHPERAADDRVHALVDGSRESDVPLRRGESAIRFAGLREGFDARSKATGAGDGTGARHAGPPCQDAVQYTEHLAYCGDGGMLQEVVRPS